MPDEKVKQHGKGKGIEGQQAPGRGPMLDRLMRKREGIRERQKDYQRQHDDRARRDRPSKQANLPAT
jgi:hypothetical protein